MILQMSKAQKAAATNVTKVTVAERESWGNNRDSVRTPCGELRNAADAGENGGPASPDLTLKDLEHRLEELQKEPEKSVVQTRFNIFMGIVVIVNILMIAVETDWGPGNDAPLEDRLGWILVDCVFTFLFMVEICVRIYWERRRWLFSLWNWFDVIVVTSAVVDVWILSFYSGKEGLQMLVILRIARLLRLVRMVKLVRALQGLYMLVTAFWHAMKSMCFIVAMMVFGVLLYSIVATNLIGRNSAFDDVRIYDDTVYERFGTVYRSMYSLFELMTLEGWDQVARPLVEEQPMTVIFIASFIFIFTFGMLNMVVAMVVEKTLEQTRQVGAFQEKQERIQMAQDLMQIITVFRDSDADGSGTLSSQELQSAFKTNEAVIQNLEAIGLPPDNAEELYSILDWDHSGEITVTEFVEGIAKVQADLPSTWDALATYCNVRRLIYDMDQLGETMAGIEARINSGDMMIQEVLTALRSLQPGSGSSNRSGLQSTW